MRVLFLEPGDFLRTPRKTNPYLDPIIDVCEKNGIDWEIWMPSRKTVNGYGPVHVKSYGTFHFVHNVIYRFFACLLCVSKQRANRWAAHISGKYILKPLLSRHGVPNLIISLSGFLVEDLYYGFPHVRAIDVQHGVIYSRHSGYFDKNRRLWPLYWCDGFMNREFWVYGQGFANCFLEHPDNVKDLQGRVKIIGDVIRAGEYNRDGAVECGSEEVRNVVVFSAQLTADLTREEMAASVKRMEEFFDEFFKKFGDRYECLVKHHPRFANLYDMTGFFAKFPQLKETKEQWAELYPRMVLHVTFMSTVTFDCASAGVPTYLLDFPAAKILKRDLFRNDYAYPYFDKTVEEILAIPTEEARKTMMEWYRKFYAPFDEKNCLRLLRGEGD